ncbi:unnamed protein product [Amoebophrya sp. A25]|nr:unnamed protein product [Amoebophrya sp. A25]|eukprot:GSA25T00009806001.1
MDPVLSAPVIGGSASSSSSSSSSRRKVGGENGNYPRTNGINENGGKCQQQADYTITEMNGHYDYRTTNTNAKNGHYQQHYRRFSEKDAALGTPWIDLCIAPEELRLEHTLPIGQAFGWTEITPSEASRRQWVGVVGDTALVLESLPSTTRMKVLNPQGHGLPTSFGEPDDFSLPPKMFDPRCYFRLDIKLAPLYAKWSAACKWFRRCSNKLVGVRLLQQDLFETMISFLMSQNNNVARISQILSRIRQKYGRRLVLSCNVSEVVPESNAARGSHTGDLVQHAVEGHLDMNHDAPGDLNSTAPSQDHAVADKVSGNGAETTPSAKSAQSHKAISGLGEMYTFPTVAEFLRSDAVTERDFRELGLGYRAKYLRGILQHLARIYGFEICPDKKVPGEGEDSISGSGPSAGADETLKIQKSAKGKKASTLASKASPVDAAGKQEAKSNKAKQSSSEKKMSSMKMVRALPGKKVLKKMSKIATAKKAMKGRTGPSKTASSNKSSSTAGDESSKRTMKTKAQATDLPTHRLEDLSNGKMPVDDVVRELMRYPGIGHKVADCIALFACDGLGLVPVDTHVWSIAKERYGLNTKLGAAESLTDKTYHLAQHAFVKQFGAEYAGWAHSVLFAAELPAFRKDL